MKVEDVLAILFIFGGGALFLLAISPVGKAVAERIRNGGRAAAPPEPDHAVYDELDRLRTDVAELQERVDFTERLLAKGSVPASDEVKPS